MELLSTWRNLYKLRYCPTTLIQTAFSAGTVYLLIAMQACSGSRIARKELRHSLGQETLVQQYLQEIGVSWNCATHISITLRRLMDEQVRPHLYLMERKNISTTTDLHISADVGDEEEKNPSGSHTHNMATGFGQSSLSAPPNHISTSAFPAPVAIQPLISTSSSNPFNSWAFQPSPGSSPDVNLLSSSPAHSDPRKYTVPISMDDPLPDNDDVDHGFGGLVSFLAHNFQRSPSTEYLGMLGGQTLSETPFVGFVGGVEDNNSPNVSNFVQTPFGTGFSNRESSSNSLGEHVPPSSHIGNDNMDLDSAPWRQSFK